MSDLLIVGGTVKHKCHRHIRTRFLKRLVRKVIHKVEVPVDYFTSAEEAKAEARRQMDEFVKKYYVSI